MCPQKNAAEEIDGLVAWGHPSKLTSNLMPSTGQAELKAALLREAELLRERDDLLRRQHLLTQEFEHRLVNGLQMVVSLLSMQSRTASTPEAAAQLTAAANRVAAFGRVHRRLHLLDHRESVEFKPYIKQLCDDLSGLLFEDEDKRAIVLTGTNFNLPTTLAVPLGFILNELITNAVKYAKGDIAIRTDISATGHSLSISDAGPGLPPNFDPAARKGLGMKIVHALVNQIGGTLHFGTADGGTRVTVSFPIPAKI
jgi:two-component system, sensor histidine kinase PdtaS